MIKIRFNPNAALMPIVFVVIALFVIYFQFYFQKSHTLIDSPQRILFQMADGQVKGFKGKLVETSDSYIVQIQDRTTFTVDSLGHTIENRITAQTVILPKINVNLVNYENR